MKSSTRQTSPRRIHARLAVLLMFAVLVSSCATTRSQLQTKPTGSSRMASAVTSQWVKVRSNPPTWYPRGTPADCPTDHRSGEWVYAKDAAGTSYFIPLHGMARDQRKSLVKEALAARSARKQVQVVAEDCALCLKEAGNIVVGVPLTMLALYGASASSPNQTVSDFELIRPFSP